MANTPSNQDYWKQASNAKRDALENRGGGAQPPRKRSKVKVLLFVAGTLLVVAGVGLALAPTIVSSLAPGLIASRSPQYLNGQANVTKTSFSWGGPQRIEGLKVTDAGNKVVATVQTIELSAGLMSLITGNLDLGTANISGVRADIVKRADGSTNLSSLPKPDAKAKPAPAPESPVLPAGLRATITLKDVNATYLDETTVAASGKPVGASLSNLNATASIAPGEAMKVNATGTTSSNQGGTGGSLAINAVITNWSNKDGKLTLGSANADATVDLKSLPMALVDAFAPNVIKGGTVAGALGETADVRIVAKGTMTQGNAEVTATAPNANMQGKFTLANKVVSGDQPLTVNVNSAGMEGLVPTLRADLAKQKVTIDALPAAQLTISDIRYVMSEKDPASNIASLVGTGANIAAQIGEVRGTVVLQEQGQPSAFVLAPLRATISAADISKPVRVQAATSATIAGNNAGTFETDITAGGLLNDKGGIAGGLPQQLAAKITAAGVATAIAQPFVQAMGVDLPADVGPTLDAQINANTTGAPKKAGGLPPLAANFAVQSQNVNAKGALNFDGTRLTSAPGGMTIQATRAGAMVGRFISPETGFAVLASRNDSKGVVVNVNSLDIPLNDKNQPDAATMVADVNITIDGIALLPVQMQGGGPVAAAQPLDVQSLAVALKVGNGGGVAGTVKGALWHESKPFTIDGNFDVAGLLTNDAQGKLTPAMATMKPTANIQINNIPATITRLAPKGPAVQDATGKTVEPMDLAVLAEALAGPTINISLAAASQGEGYTLTSAVRAERLAADVSVAGSPQKIDVKAFTARSNITPDTVRVLASAGGNPPVNMPRLVAPGVIMLAVDPISIPLNSERKPDFAAMGTAVAKITMPGRTLVTGLTSTDDKGVVKDLGTFGVEELNVNASFPVAALMGPAPSGKRATTVTMTGALLGAAPGGQVGTIGSLNSTVRTELSEKALAGPLTLNLALDQLNTAVLESVANQPGMITGALGDRAAIQLTANVAPPDQSGAPFDFAKATTTATLAIDAPRLKSSAPLSATVSPTSIRLNQASKLTWTADAAWINSQFLTPKPGSGGTQAAVLRQISPIEITLDRLVMPRAGATGAAAALEAAVSMGIATAQLVTNDGRELTLGNTAVTIASQPPGESGTPIDFTAMIAQIGVRDARSTSAAPPNVSNMKITGRVDGIVDGAGTVDPARAVVSTRADVPSIPTVLIDAFTTKDGTVVDALGPTASMKLNVERYPLSGTPVPGSPAPVIDLTASSERANASVKGTIKDNMFISQTPFTANIIEVTQALAERYIKGLPLMGTFQKSKEDLPANLTISNITAPLGNDLSKLNADIVFDPGEASFGTSSTFGELLKVFNSKTAGKVGQRLEPVSMQVRNGVATYQRWKLPLGEFTVETEGSVNLVTRTVDVVTYVPIAALSDGATSKLGLGAGGALGSLIPGAVDALTMVPFRTRGSMDGPSTNVDADLMAKNAVRGLQPEKLLQDGLKDLFKPREPKLPSAPK
jgi:hypothetical protein